MFTKIDFSRNELFWRSTKPKSFIWSGFAAAIALPSIAAAAEHRELGAHVHGAAELRIVAENGQLVAELETPLMNLTGFEHAPRSAEERDAYNTAVATLRNGSAVFDFLGAECSLVGVTVEEPAFHVHGEEDDHDDGHDDDHHHEDDRGDEHDHADIGDREDTHSELHAKYEFKCDDLEDLESIRVELFDSFSGMEEIDAFFLGDKTVTAELTSSNTEISLR